MLEPATATGVVSIAEAALRLQTNEAAIRRWVANGDLRCVHQYDSQGRRIECVILETDFLAFAQHLRSSWGLTLELTGAASASVPRRGATGAIASAVSDVASRPEVQGYYIPSSWRWADTGLWLVWVVSGLLILGAATVLAGWWAR